MRSCLAIAQASGQFHVPSQQTMMRRRDLRVTFVGATLPVRDSGRGGGAAFGSTGSPRRQPNSAFACAMTILAINTTTYGRSCVTNAQTSGTIRRAPHFGNRSHASSSASATPGVVVLRNAVAVSRCTRADPRIVRVRHQLIGVAEPLTVVNTRRACGSEQRTQQKTDGEARLDAVEQQLQPILHSTLHR